MNTTSNTKTQHYNIPWLDFAKFCAIIAVIVDHSFGILHESEKLTLFTYYSVSVFMLSTGLSTYLSFERDAKIIPNKIIKRLLKAIIPYIVCVFIFYIAVFKTFDLKDFLYYLTHFNMSLPHYYIALYIQMAIIAPFICFFIYKIRPTKLCIPGIILGLILTLAISYFTTNYTNILDIFGGGGKILGGSFLIMLYFGIIIGSFYKEITGLFSSLFLLALFTALSGISFKIICTYKERIDALIPLGLGNNPPGLSLIIYSLLVFFTLFLLGMSVKNLDLVPINIIYKGLCFVGKHSLYIFLYHLLFMHLILIRFEQIFSFNYFDNMWAKRAFYLLSMVFGSILIEYALLELLNLIKSLILLIKNPKNPS